jgi:hypothetical protein
MALQKLSFAPHAVRLEQYLLSIGANADRVGRPQCPEQIRPALAPEFMGPRIARTSELAFLDRNPQKSKRSSVLLW